jgi:bacterial/archaeal transporter family-2 protein
VSGAVVRNRLPVGLALLGGAIFALQNRVNGELGSRAGSAVWSAFVSFGSGLVVLCVLLATVPALRRAVRRAVANRLPWWTYTGGLAGGTLVAVSAVAVPRVGVATFTVGVVAGQSLGGLLVDRYGLGPGGPQPLSVPRVAGAAIAVLAVGVIRLGHGGEEVSGGVLLALLTASALGGAWSAVQQALNGRVQRATGAPLLAAWVNFAVGTVWLTVVLAVTAAAGSGPDRPWPPGLWLYTGGLLGIAFIVNAVVAVRPLGVFRLGLLTVAGQLTGGVVIDLVSPGRAGPPGPLTYLAVVLTFIAVAVAGAQSKSRRRTSSTATTVQTTR